MKTFQILVLVAIAGLAIYQVLSVGDKHAKKNDVLVVKSPQKNKSITTTSVKSQRKQSYSHVSKKIGSGISTVQGRKENGSSASNRKPMEDKGLKILAISWESFFTEWKNLLLESILDASTSPSVDSKKICEVSIGLFGKTIKPISFSQPLQAQVRNGSFTLYHESSNYLDLEIKPNHDKLEIATTELIKFCRDNAAIVNNAISR